MSKKKSSYFEDDDNYEEIEASDDDNKSSSDDDDDEEDDINQEEIEVEEQEEEEDEDDDDEDDDDESIDEEQMGGAEDIDLGIDDDGNPIEQKTKKSKKITIKPSYVPTKNSDDEDDDDDDGELYLKKFDKEIKENYILNFHPECALQNYDEIFAMTKVVRDEHGIIVDDLHKTIPYLTKYEKARILGQRAKQINAGSMPFVKVPENVIDGYLIAELELQQKRIPFIIRRPLPNGGSEYWSLKDLENITF